MTSRALLLWGTLLWAPTAAALPETVVELEDPARRLCGFTVTKT